MRKLLSNLPIKYKLGLTYGLQLTILLLSLALVTRYSIAQNLIVQTDETLQILSGQIQNYIYEQADTMTFDETIRNLNLAPEYGFYLVSDDGTLDDTYQRSTNLELMLETSESFFNIDGADGGDDWRIFQKALNQNQGWLVISLKTDIYDTVFAALDKQIVSIIIVLGIISILISALFTSYVLYPLRRITCDIKSLSRDNFESRLNYQGSMDEIGQLATTFDRMMSQLHASLKREETFIDNAAHELRTPLTAMKGHISLALKHDQTANQYYQTLLEVDVQITRLIKLSNDLLFLSRMKHSDIQKQFEQFDFFPYVELIISQFTQPIQEKNIQLEEVLSSPLMVYGEVDLLIRLVSNLLENAVNYTPKDETITIDIHIIDNNLQLNIRNTGIGIPEHKLQFLFDRFYRVEADRHRKAEQITNGTGLGLAIAKEIVLLHNGNIMVDSVLNEYSLFIVTIPTHILTVKPTTTT